MTYDEFKNQLNMLVSADTKPEEQVDILNQIIGYADEQNKQILDLQKSCNKIKSDYFDLALNNKRVQDEPEKKKSVEDKPKRIFKYL